MIKVLLVEPDFPYSTKSKHRANKIHKNFVPIGLLKLGSYYKNLGDEVKLVRGEKSKKEFNGFIPDKILITSLFTYWSKYVWDSVAHYRKLFPNAEITIGGIYVTLHCDRKDFREKAEKFNVKWHKGLHKEAEKFIPDYSLIPEVDYHAMHAMRGCIRKCKFCGVWKLEPDRTYKTAREVIQEIKKVGKNKVIFFDNNFLANKHIKTILKKLADLRINNRVVHFECQSGLDGRILEKSPDLAPLLKKARFENIRIAWDWSLKDAPSIKRQIDILVDAGYNPKDITVFMIYNFDIPYEEMVKKASFCKKWGVQISDCRYRPLDSTHDNYNPQSRKEQTSEDYYIHTIAGWTDEKIRKFRRLIREQNIGIRYGKDGEYHRELEKIYHPIKVLHKSFGIPGKTPKLEVLNKNGKLKERIKLMKMVRLVCKKNKIDLPDLSKIDDDKINKFLLDFYNKEISINKKH